jgi:hypothetical protein
MHRRVPAWPDVTRFRSAVCRREHAVGVALSPGTERLYLQPPAGTRSLLATLAKDRGQPMARVAATLIRDAAEQAGIEAGPEAPPRRLGRPRKRPTASVAVQTRGDITPDAIHTFRAARISRLRARLAAEEVAQANG